MIVVRLLLLALSLYGLSRLTMRRLKLPVEGALPLTMVSIATTVTLAGMINLLSEAVWLIWAAGLVLAVRSLWRRESLRAVLTPGTCFFAAGAVGLAILTSGAHFLEYDDFSHWALVARTILLRDALPTFRDTTLSFLNYPPGSACWIYFFCRLCGSESESMMLFAQSLMMLACLLPLFLIAPKQPVWTALLASVLAGFVFLSHGTQLLTLHVDRFLPMVAAAGMLLALSSARNPRRAALLALPFSTYAYLIKNSGILFSLFTSLLLILIALRNRRQGHPPTRRHWRDILGVCLAPAVVLYIWNRHTTMVFENASATKHAMRPGQLLSTFGEKTASDISAICSSYFSALGEASFLSIMCLLMMVLCLLAICVRRRSLYLPGVFALCASAFVAMVYLAGLLLMYLFSMPTGEAMNLASLERYIDTLDLWLVLMTAAMVLASLDICPPQGRARFLPSAVAGAAAVALLFFSGFPEASVLQHRQLYPQSSRAKIDATLKKQGIPTGQRYILVGMQDGGMAYYIFQYLLDPAFLSLNLEEWRQADAIILYEPKPLEMVYIEETVLPSGEAPVIYDCR